jgi:hypothetical protein
MIMSVRNSSKKFYKYARAVKNHPDKRYRIRKQIPAPDGWNQHTITIQVHMFTAGGRLAVEIFYCGGYILSDARPLPEIWQHEDLMPYIYIALWWEDLTEKVRQCVKSPTQLCD